MQGLVADVRLHAGATVEKVRATTGDGKVPETEQRDELEPGGCGEGGGDALLIEAASQLAKLDAIAARIGEATRVKSFAAAIREVVPDIEELLASGRTWVSIVAALNASGLSGRGGKPLGVHNVATVFYGARRQLRLGVEAPPVQSVLGELVIAICETFGMVPISRVMEQQLGMVERMRASGISWQGLADALAERDVRMGPDQLRQAFYKARRFRAGNDEERGRIDPSAVLGVIDEIASEYGRSKSLQAAVEFAYAGIRNLRAAGVSWNRVAGDLTARGLIARKGGRVSPGHLSAAFGMASRKRRIDASDEASRPDGAR